MRSLFQLAFCAALALSLLACGGSGSESKTANDSPDASVAQDDSDTSSNDPPEPSGPDCSDGTCFACGAGICPSGAYCDQGARGGAACAWLPECSKTPSCGCITGVLKGCSCDESGAGPVVSCE